MHPCKGTIKVFKPKQFINTSFFERLDQQFNTGFRKMLKRGLNQVKQKHTISKQYLQLILILIQYLSQLSFKLLDQKLTSALL